MRIPALIALFLAATAAPAVEVQFITDLNPAGVLHASDLDGQAVRSDLYFRLLAEDLPELYLQSEDPTAFYNYALAGSLSSRSLAFLNQQETRIDSGLCWTPTASGGLALTLDDGINDVMRFDLTVGGGVIVNEAFTGVVARADLAANFILGPVTVGPHLGVLDYAELDPDDDLHAELDGDTGMLAGVKFTAGSDRVRFDLLVDYHREAEFRLQPDPGYTAGPGFQQTVDIDMSGIMIGMGLEIVLP